MAEKALRLGRSLILIALSALILTGAGSVYAEMTPLRIAVNHETTQCAEFGCGDECSDCILPEGWIILGYSFKVECPAGYSVVEIEPTWMPLANEFCCTPGHSGLPGDCSGVVVNRITKHCAFEKDVVEKCSSLPFGWQPHGRECPYSWAESVQCSPAALPWPYFVAGILAAFSLLALLRWIIWRR